MVCRRCEARTAGTLGLGGVEPALRLSPRDARIVSAIRKAVRRMIGRSVERR